jgi:hypothetical protein
LSQLLSYRDNVNLESLNQPALHYSTAPRCTFQMPLTLFLYGTAAYFVRGSFDAPSIHHISHGCGFAIGGFTRHEYAITDIERR